MTGGSVASIPKVVYISAIEKDILTDAYLYNDSTRSIIEDYVGKIEQYVTDNHLSQVLPKSRTLVLEIRRTGRCGYYFVDHENQCLFWLEPYDASEMIEYLHIKMTLPLIEWEIKSQYWYHNELFPDNIPMTDETIKTYKSWLLSSAGDMLTSSRSTSTYSPEEIDKLLAIIGDVKADDINAEDVSGIAWIMYRVMSRLCHNRFIELHGQYGARLNRGQSIIHKPRKGGLLVKITSPFLFFGPQEQFSKLIELSTDSIIKRIGWHKFLEEIGDEWKSHTLFATVLLNANVAFLAIQSVDSAKPVFGDRSSAQRASYVSTVASVGAVFLGLALVRLHHKGANMSFLANRSATVIGLELVAVMYCLPYALSMWSTLLFFIAFEIMIFSSSDITTDILISVSSFMVVIMSIWIISAPFENSPYWRFSAWNWMCKLSKHLREMWRPNDVSKSFMAARPPILSTPRGDADISAGVNEGKNDDESGLGIVV